MPTKVSNDEHLGTVRLAHLNMIQGVISRISGFSANAKNFCITLLAAVIGISFQYRLSLCLLLLAAAFVVFVFGALDIYYLAQERRFRRFYGEVAARPLADALQLDLDPGKLDLGKYLSAIRSFSTGGYYTLLLIATAGLLFIAYGRSDDSRLGTPDSTVGTTDQQQAGTAADELAGTVANASIGKPARSSTISGAGRTLRAASNVVGTEPDPRSAADTGPHK